MFAGIDGADAIVRAMSSEKIFSSSRLEPESDAGPSHAASLALVAWVLCYPLFSKFVVPHAPAAASVLDEMRVRVLNEAPRWLYAGVALLLALRWQRSTPAALGLRRPGAMTWFAGLAGSVLAFALAVAARTALAGLDPPPDDPAAVAAMIHGSLGYAAIMAVGAGVVEEVLYRGVLVAALTRLTRRPIASVLLSGVAFVLAHGLSFNWLQMAMAAMATIALSLLYVWRRDLVANAFAHALIDFISFAQTLH